MKDFTRKKEPDLNLLRKRILEEARNYTDQAILDIARNLQDSSESETDQVSDEPNTDDLSNGDADKEYNKGIIKSVTFLNDNKKFTYNESYKYGTLYVNSDGDYMVDVTAKVVSDDQSVSNIEIQITRTDDEG